MAIFTAIGGAVLGVAGTAATVAGVGIAAGVVGTAASISASNKAAKASAQAVQTQVSMQRAEATRQRRSAIRADIVRRSQMAAQAQAMGVTQTSMVAGGLSSASSQLGSNLGYGSMMSGLSSQYTNQTGQAAQYGAQADMFGAIGQIGFGVVPYSNQISGVIKKITGQ